MASWVVISVVICRGAILLALISGLMTPLLTTHEPPSRVPYQNYTLGPIKRKAHFILHGYLVKHSSRM